MPRASWKGFLRLSLVSCPIYLTPATTKTKTIRLNRIWVPSEEPATIEREPVVQRPSQVRPSLPVNTSLEDEPEPAETYAGPATRVALRPHDPHSGEEIERDEVVKGYEYERGQFVTFAPEELKALDIESSRTVDLSTFVPRADIDPVYFSTPYYVYPDGPRCHRGVQRDRPSVGRGRNGRDRDHHPKPARAHGHGRAARCRLGLGHVARRRRVTGRRV